MQESGPKLPKADGPSRGSKARTARNAAAGTPAAGYRRTSDPVAKWLTLSIFVIAILWLAGVLSAVMFGMINPSGPPQTATERDLNYYTSLTQAGTANSEVYARYVDTLIRANQLFRAQQALDKALAAAKKDRSYLYAEQARLSLAKKDYNGTISAADKAISEATKELKEFMQANVKANRVAAAGARMPEAYSTASLAKAEALVNLEDYAQAIKAYDVYLKVNPTDSDILVERGSLKVRVGDKKGAEADYRAAMKFIPDYQPALDGLKKIGAAQ